MLCIKKEVRAHLLNPEVMNFEFSYDNLQKLLRFAVSFRAFSTRTPRLFRLVAWEAEILDIVECTGVSWGFYIRTPFLLFWLFPGGEKNPRKGGPAPFAWEVSFPGRGGRESRLSQLHLRVGRPTCKWGWESKNPTPSGARTPRMSGATIWKILGRCRNGCHSVTKKVTNVQDVCVTCCGNRPSYTNKIAAEIRTYQALGDLCNRRNEKYADT